MDDYSLDIEDKKDFIYILDEDNNPVNCSLREWNSFLKSSRRIVKQDTVDGKFVSTVFLGTDYGIEKPLLFETMIFQKEGDYGHDLYCKRYSTYNESVEGHKKAIKWVNNGCKD